MFVVENEGQNGEGSEDQPSAPPKEIVRPVDALPGGPCLCALAALRHTKFFQVCFLIGLNIELVGTKGFLINDFIK